ncbi:hypothetical protein CEUSTIGMA_g8934.t1 [Chlamydomonas eustigma]|uniref:PHD-type domain-containing protein n=1 Tax=Chlamydomonas eustigma TaxID=1157962 RepID=A0A250XEP4_9CHLO|nr:hypothetical protein CEUSTIGMA_g8934.t1 [Chlamydomonas eustigma]|eukprot:GAX81506.1 hypothetical protein CEUSTIGMA_g8934.t1 [Chlamydomonas eustigma]
MFNPKGQCTQLGTLGALDFCQGAASSATSTSATQVSAQFCTDKAETCTDQNLDYTAHTEGYLPPAISIPSMHGSNQQNPPKGDTARVSTQPSPVTNQFNEPDSKEAAPEVGIDVRCGFHTSDRSPMDLLLLSTSAHTAPTMGNTTTISAQQAADDRDNATATSSGLSFPSEGSQASQGITVGQLAPKVQPLKDAPPVHPAEAHSTMTPSDVPPVHLDEAHSTMTPSDVPPLHPAEAHSTMTPSNVPPVHLGEAHSTMTPSDVPPMHLGEAHSTMTPSDVPPMHPAEAHSTMTPSDVPPVHPAEAHSTMTPSDVPPVHPGEAHSTMTPSDAGQACSGCTTAKDGWLGKAQEGDVTDQQAATANTQPRGALLLEALPSSDGRVPGKGQQEGVMSLMRDLQQQQCGIGIRTDPNGIAGFEGLPALRPRLPSLVLDAPGIGHTEYHPRQQLQHPLWSLVRPSSCAPVQFILPVNVYNPDHTVTAVSLGQKKQPQITQPNQIRAGGRYISSANPPMSQEARSLPPQSKALQQLCNDQAAVPTIIRDPLDGYGEDQLPAAYRRYSQFHSGTGSRLIVLNNPDDLKVLLQQQQKQQQQQQQVPRGDRHVLSCHTYSPPGKDQERSSTLKQKRPGIHSRAAKPNKPNKRTKRASDPKPHERTLSEALSSKVSDTKAQHLAAQESIVYAARPSGLAGDVKVRVAACLVLRMLNQTGPARSISFADILSSQVLAGQEIFFRGHKGMVRGGRGCLQVGPHVLDREQVDDAGAAELVMPGFNSITLKSFQMLLHSQDLGTHINVCAQCMQSGLSLSKIGTNTEEPQHPQQLLIQCGGCPLAYHPRCIGLDGIPSRTWLCTRCSQVAAAHKAQTSLHMQDLGSSGLSFVQGALPMHHQSILQELPPDPNLWGSLLQSGNISLNAYIPQLQYQSLGREIITPNMLGSATPVYAVNIPQLHPGLASQAYYVNAPNMQWQQMRSRRNSNSEEDEPSGRTRVEPDMRGRPPLPRRSTLMEAEEGIRRGAVGQGRGRRRRSRTSGATEEEEEEEQEEHAEAVQQQQYHMPQAYLQNGHTKSYTNQGSARIHDSFHNKPPRGRASDASGHHDYSQAEMYKSPKHEYPEQASRRARSKRPSSSGRPRGRPRTPAYRSADEVPPNTLLPQMYPNCFYPAMNGQPGPSAELWPGGLAPGFHLLPGSFDRVGASLEPSHWDHMPSDTHSGIRSTALGGDGGEERSDEYQGEHLSHAEGTEEAGSHSQGEDEEEDLLEAEEAAEILTALATSGIRATSQPAPPAVPRRGRKPASAASSQGRRPAAALPPRSRRKPTTMYDYDVDEVEVRAVKRTRKSGRDSIPPADELEEEEWHQVGQVVEHREVVQHDTEPKQDSPAQAPSIIDVLASEQPLAFTATAEWIDNQGLKMAEVPVPIIHSEPGIESDTQGPIVKEEVEDVKTEQKLLEGQGNDGLGSGTERRLIVNPLYNGASSYHSDMDQKRSEGLDALAQGTGEEAIVQTEAKGEGGREPQGVAEMLENAVTRVSPGLQQPSGFNVGEINHNISGVSVEQLVDTLPILPSLPDCRQGIIQTTLFNDNLAPLSHNYASSAAEHNEPSPFRCTLAGEEFPLEKRDGVSVLTAVNVMNLNQQAGVVASNSNSSRYGRVRRKNHVFDLDEPSSMVQGVDTPGPSTLLQPDSLEGFMAHGDAALLNVDVSNASLPMKPKRSRARKVSVPGDAQQASASGGGEGWNTSPGPGGEYEGSTGEMRSPPSRSARGMGFRSSLNNGKSSRIIAAVSGETREAAKARATPGSVLEGVPVYRGYHPQWVNSCANCGLGTSPVWRKGWALQPNPGSPPPNGKVELANLCNACGLRYKEGAALEKDPNRSQAVRAKPTASSKKGEDSSNQQSSNSRGGREASGRSRSQQAAGASNRALHGEGGEKRSSGNTVLDVAHIAAPQLMPSTLVTSLAPELPVGVEQCRKIVLKAPLSFGTPEDVMAPKAIAHASGTSHVVSGAHTLTPLDLRVEAQIGGTCSKGSGSGDGDASREQCGGMNPWTGNSGVDDASVQALNKDYEGTVGSAVASHDFLGSEGVPGMSSNGLTATMPMP